MQAVTIGVDIAIVAGDVARGRQNVTHAVELFGMLRGNHLSQIGEPTPPIYCKVPELLGRK